MKSIFKKIFSLIVVTAIVMSFSICLVACDKTQGENALRFVVPDGTPALSIAKLFSDNQNIDGQNVDYNIIPAQTIATEIGTEKADMIIMPTNLGAKLVNQGAAYKLVSVKVEGSLYVISKPENASGENNTILIDDFKGKKIVSIGKGKTPDKIFKYIIDNTDGVEYKENKLIFEDKQETTIQFVANGTAAKVELENEKADFAIVGEPVATVFGTQKAGGYSARLNLQNLYSDISGFENYPQASLFVKNNLVQNKEFMTKLFTALNKSNEWITENPDKVFDLLKQYGSKVPFPASCISRCNISSGELTQNDKDGIIAYLKLLMPEINWDSSKLF